MKKPNTHSLNILSKAISISTQQVYERAYNQLINKASSRLIRNYLYISMKKSLPKGQHIKSYLKYQQKKLQLILSFKKIII